VGDWSERVLRDSPADEEDKWSLPNELFEDDRTIARPSRGSSVAHPVTGNSLRALITIGVTAAVVVVVVLGIALRIPTDQFSAYMTPLLVLAGTVLGYWFGSEKS
jgi:hydrogenase/urease accessory protein HupE